MPPRELGSQARNLASQMLVQAAATLATSGSAALDGQVRVPLTHGVANYLFSGFTNVTLGVGAGDRPLDARADGDARQRPAQF